MSEKLSDLIIEAEKTTRGHAREQPTRKVPRIPWRYVFAMLLAGTFGYAGTRILAVLFPPSQKQIAEDLQTVLDRARDAIETSKAEAGKLPDALPNAALASVVKYEHDNTDYQLTATIMGVKVTMERSGRKTTELGDRR